MNKHTFSVLMALTTSISAAALLCLPASAQVGFDLGGGTGIGISGIPGIDASPYPADDIQPGTVGGGNLSVIANPAGTALSPNAGRKSSAYNPAVHNAPGMLTNTQAVDLASGSTPNLPQTSMNIMANDSVDQSPIPSDQWNYGFPNEGYAPFQGVSKGTVGGFLPQTSTASVDLNTYDGPLRSGGYGGYVGLDGFGNLNFSVPLGNGVSIGASVNPVSAFGAVQNFFGQ